MLLTTIRRTYTKNISFLPTRHKIINTKIQYNFSDSNQKQSQNNNKFSLRDIYQRCQEEGKKFIAYAKHLQWYHWAGIVLLGGTMLLLNQRQEEIYPINSFEEQVFSYLQKPGDMIFPKKGFSQITVVIHISPPKYINYEVKFCRNDMKYVVNYDDQSERFKNVLQVLRRQGNFKVKYEYAPSMEIKYNKIHLISQIISVLFFTAFFLKGQSLNNVRKAKKSGGSQNLQNMIGQKKSFEVIRNSPVRFKDVAGLDQSKVQIQQFVDFLKNSQKYKKLGARIPKGVLLSGPPGTGKTMLAKACAGEAGTSFIATSGSDFVQIFVGVGASRVRDLFQLAKQNSPSIIFIDQIDAVGRKRSGAHSSHDQRDNTLNQILVEMDGFQTKSNVIVMAATNRQNLLDSALIRPGRFDRIVQVNLPDLEGRRQIFLVHLSKIKMKNSRTKQEYARRLATLTPGFSGAQIANLCNQSAILAARNGKDEVDSHDLEMATQRIIGGVQRKSIISEQEKKTVSVHQSGHAVVSWFLKGADPLLKLTIIPRSKGSLGFAQYFVNETNLNTKSQLLDRICFILGGRCAQQHFFGKITNGASDDLKKAYELAHNIVVKLGMNDQIGYVGYKDPEYLRPYSDKIGAQIDKQIMKIISDCTERTRTLVKQHEQHIRNLSAQLFQKQTLTIKQIRRILGQRDFTSNETYQKYLQIEKQLEKQKLPEEKIQQLTSV